MTVRPPPKRWFWIVPAVGLLVAAYLQARGLNAFFRRALTSAPPAAWPAARAPVAPTLRASGDPILARNPFDSVTGSLAGGPSPSGESRPPPDKVDPLRAPRCNDVRVIITTQSENPLDSTAVVQAQTESRGFVRRVGDEVGDRRVAFIGRNPLEWSPAVWLSDEAGLCQTLLFDQPALAGPAAPPPKPAVRAPAASRASPATLPPEIASKIARVGPGSFRIERSAVEAILEEGTAFVRSVRMRPVQANGKVVGFQLHRVRPGTLLEVLGLKDGDQVQSLNGFALDGPARALQAYARLRTADEIRVTGLRGGKPFEIAYRIQ
jgi:general secretion pathway protein C